MAIFIGILTFIEVLVCLLLILLVLFLRLCFHFAKKFCCTKSSKTVIKQAFIDTGRQRLVNEEELIGEGDELAAKDKRLQNLSYFVENDYNVVLHA